MTYAFQPAAQPSVAILGEEALFPVRRIFCVGRNYAAHAREMGADPSREPPFFFAKPGDAVTPSGSTIPFPANTADLHHEIELVVAIGRGGVEISPEAALDHVFGYAVGVDLTRRDRQAEMKAGGKPWEIGKGFDRSAPIGPIRRATGPLTAGRIWLDVDGERRQEGDLSDMIWPVADVIAILSKSWELAAGDLIFTGTPEGVGPVQAGQTITGGVDGVGEVRVSFAG